jgi:hypothetical protein
MTANGWNIFQTRFFQNECFMIFHFFYHTDCSISVNSFTSFCVQMRRHLAEKKVIVIAESVATTTNRSFLARLLRCMSRTRMSVETDVLPSARQSQHYSQAQMLPNMFVHFVVHRESNKRGNRYAFSRHHLQFCLFAFGYFDNFSLLGSTLIIVRNFNPLKWMLISQYTFRNNLFQLIVLINQFLSIFSDFNSIGFNTHALCIMIGASL